MTTDELRLFEAAMGEAILREREACGEWLRMAARHCEPALVAPLLLAARGMVEARKRGWQPGMTQAEYEAAWDDYIRERPKASRAGVPPVSD